MNWSIQPYESVGPLLIGQTREEVRLQLGSDHESFAKVKGANLTDAYDRLGIHLYYSDDDTLEFVECFGPVQLEIVGIALLGQRWSDVEQALASAGYSAEAADDGFNFADLGLSLVLDEELIDGVGVYCRGYYD